MINVKVCASCEHFKVEKDQNTQIVYHTCNHFKRHMFMIDETNWVNCETTDPERLDTEGFADININDCPYVLEHLVMQSSQKLTSNDLFAASLKARRRTIK